MLFCLFALAIPLIVHLFNFRRHRTVYFSNTATLKNIERESAKTKKLKYIIVLIMRMLFIAGLVFAFASPYKIEQKMTTDDAGNLVAVYIDNSMSMQSRSSEISLIEDARSSARQLVGNVSPSQRFVLLTNSRNVENEYPMSQDEMLMSIDGMKTTAGILKFSDLYENLKMIKKRGGFRSASLFVYSDFQDDMFDLDGIVVDSTIQIVAFPLCSDFQQNVYVDTVWLSSPVLQIGLANEMNVRLKNESERDIKGLPINLEIDNQAVAFTTADISANGTTTVGIQFVLNEPGQKVAKVSINDFPITFDDTYNIVIGARHSIKIVELTNEIEAADRSDNPLQVLFSNDSIYDYHRVSASRIDQQYLNDCQMIVVNDRSSLNATLWQSVVDFAKEGGSVVVFPSETASIYVDTLNVNMLAVQHSFFDDVFVNVPDNADFPKVFKHVNLKKEFPNSLTLIGLQNGEPLITLSKVGSGNVFMFSSRIDSQWNNLSDNALFVPLMMKMAFMGGGLENLSYVIGRDKELIIKDVNVFSDGGIRIRDEHNTFEFIPITEIRDNHVVVRLFDQLPNSGVFDVCNGDDVIEKTAWNDSRLESKMSFNNQNEVDKALKNKGLNVSVVLSAADLHSDEIMEAVAARSNLWKSFIILALIAMLTEILILRFWK